MAGTTLSAVKADLYDRLSLVYQGDADLKLYYAHPGDQRGRKSIWFGDARADVEIPTMRAGRKARDESYSLDVVFSVMADGQDGLEAEALTVDLFKTFDEFLADHPQLDGELETSDSHPWWLLLESWESFTGWTDVGFQSGILARIRVKARLY